MEAKRAHAEPRTSSSSSGSGDSSCGSPGSPSSSPAPATSSAPAPGNAFANDGSFMEMFKKKMEEEARRKTETQQTGGAARASEQGQASVDRKPPPVTSFVGKRRGGVFLKTGVVAKKQKQDSEREPGKSDAWTKYMAEVKKYKAHQCGDDDKTRPLVK
ncbi:telomerase RNA component interacting RNase [Betta splendens]|uniref:Telomerase RNA component interacting RNase n=1 Tax=Betta splendens TaxID=158456 RepID=A0A6P7N5Q5_BETSP|nr:telomerase RNA component interacting RNase [Betta splendens]XP_029014643.1 telomerase RNA component interacting RNase [Betta splendens]